MNQKTPLQQNNEGFSLVELIVTILISSVVMLGVVGLLTTGLNLYKNVNAETRLQTEGQAACGRINELVQETLYMRSYTIGDDKALVLMTGEESGNRYWYYVVWDAGEKLLLLAKEAVEETGGVISNTPDSDDVTAKVSSMTGSEQKKRYLLAQYVDSFTFREIDSKLYYLELMLATDGKQFSTGQFINVRNQ